ncbi:MAG: hypothetical protein L3J71_11170 [Victivallaceae bacterium]|nr:hypothetical protein [Victivallaceae bacterium]
MFDDDNHETEDLFEYELFDEDLFADRNIDNDDLIDELDLDLARTDPDYKPEANIFGNSANNGTGCLIFILALPAAILLLMLL